MKIYKSSIVAIILILLTSCSSHQPLAKLVGNDRDEHGCLPSAGFTWSYALNDCIRVWEAGERFDSDLKSVFLIFSPDSTYAEIFAGKNESVLCKRKKGQCYWQRRRGKEFVSIANGVTTVHIDNFDYTKTIK